MTGIKCNTVVLLLYPALPYYTRLCYRHSKLDLTWLNCFIGLKNRSTRVII
uniref:Uncharacterized protein n=1 Tax=Myoviridae sp. ctj3P51 TaxID=2826687 RepID=A0A8S5NQ80_9CAUD|nr:MAG TPA: hypothetical protein [Myoviridae sp. ctj3P51]